VTTDGAWRQGCKCRWRCEGSTHAGPMTWSAQRPISRPLFRRVSFISYYSPARLLALPSTELVHTARRTMDIEDDNDDDDDKCLAVLASPFHVPCETKFRVCPTGVSRERQRERKKNKSPTPPLPPKPCKDTKGTLHALWQLFGTRLTNQTPPLSVT
jgi:hypothetical protein